MEAAPVNIVQYFDGSKQGIIPLFQRPYSWEQKDWSTLWEDLMAQYDQSDRTSHFMGAIVTVPVRSVPVGVTKHLVIDGQQRLTTITLLLCALRDKAEQTNDLPTAGIIGDLLINRHYKSPDDLKLVPTQVDRAAYNALIYKNDLASYEETKLVQGFKYFRKKLAGKDDADIPISASQCLQAIQQSLQAVMINLSESDDPYLIFESLNHKGKPLNQADLVRNYVLMRFQHSTSAGGDQEVAYEKFWRPIEDRLNSVMPEFLRHYGMRNGKNVRKGDIYTACKADLENALTVEDVKTYLGAMKSAASSYEKFIRPEEEVSENVSRRLKGILELDSTVFYPLLLRIFKDWKSEVMSEEQTVRCLDLLESYYLRRAVCNVPTNGLNKLTLEFCLGYPKSDVDLWLRDRIHNGSGTSRCPKDDEFERTLLVEQIYPRRKIARYMLVALEEAFEHKEPVDVSVATIEHIMPQTLTDAWRVELGEKFHQTHENWKDTIGNLTLTGYNSELSNASFSEKKTMLSNTHFELSRGLLILDGWNATQIESRGKVLAKRAVNRWSIDFS